MARILVADDETGLRTFVAEALAGDGHVVAQAADGAEAAQRLARESFDLLITDLRMPRLDGMALLRQMRAEQPDLDALLAQLARLVADRILEQGEEPGHLFVGAGPVLAAEGV